MPGHVHMCWLARRPGKDWNENKGLAHGRILCFRGCKPSLRISRERPNGGDLVKDGYGRHRQASGWIGCQQNVKVKLEDPEVHSENPLESPSGKDRGRSQTRLRMARLRFRGPQA
jgi:hypothetical protein